MRLGLWGWWRRRRDRKVVAWLRSPDGLAYLTDHGGNSWTPGVGALGIDVVRLMLEEEEENNE